MSLKDLFEEKKSANKSLYNVNADDLVREGAAESSLYLQAYQEDKKRVIPNLDLSNPKNFARFGSAELYYEKAFEHIQKYYPYDGSKYEKLAFSNSGSILDLYILDKEYPKTTGFVSIGPTGPDYTGAKTSGAGSGVTGFKNTTNPEYILFRGGPHAAQAGFSHKDDIKLSKANVYKESDFRASNLAINMVSGSTIEFWLKKEAFAGSSGEREMIFDLWNNTALADAAANKPYARMNVSCVHGSANTITFFHQSGSIFHKADLDTGLATIADNKWHHYAITAVNNGSDLEVSLYVDGGFKEKSTGSSKAMQAVTGAMVATIGATVTQMNGDASGGIGFGKLSGSLDEFRYWKKARTTKQISRNWKNTVDGGTNTDTANTSLGVYYKFNEGITGTSSFDQKVLDYSGRVTNGTFVGYNSNYSRTADSAIDLSGLSIAEDKDPILYSFHPLVVTKLADLKSFGKVHDVQNPSAIQNMVPGWIIEEEQERDDVVLKHLLQVMATEFDELSMLITSQNSVKNVSYISGSITGSFVRPVPYSRRLLNSNGFFTPEIFTQASFFEDLQDRNDDAVFSGSLESVKNLIYNNIYNNLIAIQKSKGTERSIKNLLHCIGIDEDIIKINLYANNSVYELKDNFKTRVVKTRSLDFGGSKNHFVATAYQYKDANFSDSQNFISGTFTSGSETTLGYSVETEIVFPPAPLIGTQASVLRSYEEITASLFGQHTAEDDAIDKGDDLTFRTNDDSHFSVFTVRPEPQSKDAKIIVSGSKIGQFETETIKSLYDGDKYNIVFSVAPTKQGFFNALSGASAAEIAYEAKIQVVSMTYDQVEDNISATQSLTFAQGVDFLQNNKRIYIGSHYTNFTSSILQRSDAKINSCRVWLHNLDDQTIKAHNRDIANFGTINPKININPTSTSLAGVEIPTIETLALHWGFETNTSSDASGRMTIADLSSGSAETRNRYGWLGTVSNKLHTGRADFYPSNDSTAIDVDFISSARQALPEVSNSDDMTKILLEGDDVTFERQSRPVDIIFSIEKSFYQSLSSELLSFFATIDDFHNLIGHPVNRYRQDYKDLGKLRQLLFEKFEDIADIEKYVNYYKWFDSSVNKMIENLIPASALFTDDISNVIESHVLERNKYWSKFPTLEMKGDDPVATIKGIDELKYNWKTGHAPILQHATAELILRSGNAAQHLLKKFTLISTNGVSKTYTFFVGGVGPPSTGDVVSDEVVIQLSGLSSQSEFTEQVVAAIASSNGHNGAILTSRSSTTNLNDTVTLKQRDAGRAGNTAITLSSFIAIYQTMNGGATNTSFAGGTKNENRNCFWWKNRADRGDSLSSGDANVDADRQSILDVITTDISGSGKTLVDISSGSKVKYQGFRYTNTSLSRIKDLVIDNLNSSNQINKPHENRKYTFYKTAIASPFASSSLAITGSDLNAFKDCADALVPTELQKTKYEFRAFVSSSTGPLLENSGHVLFPFVLMSRPGASASLGQATELSTFKLNLELTNIHKDIVFHNDTVLQGPFTDAHVGGNQHRHTALNTGSDSYTNRAEAWVLEVDTQNLKLVNPASAKGAAGGHQRPRATMLRDEVAKRFINIKNIKSTTGSLILGNYDKNYQIFQSSDRKVNNFSFVKSEGFTISNDTQSPFISGTHDSALPVRTVNKNIFVERFNSPGGPETMARGMLDPESEQFSVYNGMNYRNMLVRSILHGRSGSFLTNHTEFGGTDATFGPLTASFHKTYRNRQIRLETNEVGVPFTSSVFDNGYIQHAIPASDRQYSWITASLVNHALGTSAPLGYAPRSGKLPPASGLTSVSRDAFVLVTASLEGVSNTAEHGAAASQRGTQPTPLNHVGLNIWSYDPVTGSNNTLGLPLNAPIFEYHTGLAHAVSSSVLTDSEFALGIGLRQNYDLINAASVATVGPPNPKREKEKGLLERAKGALGRGAEGAGEDTGTGGTAYTLYALNLRRNGGFNHPSWKQIRTGDHPVARFNKRNNIVSYIAPGIDVPSIAPGMAKNVPSRLVHANQPAVSINAPNNLNLTFGNPIVYSFSNETDYFADQSFSNNVLKARHLQKRNKTAYKNMLDLYSGNNTLGTKNPIAGAFASLSYQETVYPPREFMHSSHSRGRENFEISYWRNKRTARIVPANAFVNSMGSKIAASGAGGASFATGQTSTGNGYGVATLKAKDDAGTITQNPVITDPCSSRWPLDAASVSASHLADGGAQVNGIINRTFNPATELFEDNPIANTYVNRQPLGLSPEGAFGQSRHNGSAFAAYYLPAHQDTGELQAAYAHYHMGEISGAFEGATGLLDSVSSSVRLGQTINRRVMERYAQIPNPGATVKNKLFILGGDTKWEAGTQALAQGRSRIGAPFYEKYEDFAEDIRVVGKDYSILPEFRISEHMDYYINTQKGDFTAPNKNILSLSGAALDPTVSDLNRSIFSKIYSTSDFMKMFGVIATDHKNITSPNGQFQTGAPSAISVTCKALMKFVPYEGFYPMQRAMQLGTEFSRSYGDSVVLTGSQGHPRTLFNPFFAPGIMYNSLKSGIACDYPIFTSGSTRSEGFASAPGDRRNVDLYGGRKTSGSFDTRIPFEAILDPPAVMRGVGILDQEPHPSASLDSTASFGSTSTPLYNLAAHNFFSEIVSFYLEGNVGFGQKGALSTFTSAPDLAGAKFFNVEPTNVANSGQDGVNTPKEYRMRLYLHNSNKFTSYEKYREEMARSTEGEVGSAEAGTATFSGELGEGTFSISPRSGIIFKGGVFYTDALHEPSIVVYERSGSSPYRFLMPSTHGSLTSYNNVPADDRGGLNYVRGSSYGPPHTFTVIDNHAEALELVMLQMFSGALGNSGAPTYSPYTPPYFDGFSYLEYIFKPTRTGYHSAEEVLESLDFKSIRLTNFLNVIAFSDFKTDQITDQNDILVNIQDAMSITSSINPIQTFQSPNPFFDENGDPESFTAESTMTRFAIQPRFECPIFDFKNAEVTLPTFGSGSVVRGTWHQYGQIPEEGKGVFMEIQNIPDDQLEDPVLTGSFASLVGFPTKKKKLGRITTQRKVTEAVVAIPFVRLNTSGQEQIHFYKIDRSKLGEEAAEEVKDMEEKAKKYVLPPVVDFITNPEVDPVAMYIFEFDHIFNQRDIQNMWQNLPPESLMDIKEPKLSKKTISHSLLPPDFFGPNPQQGTALVSPANTLISHKTQWFIFKIKKKADVNYFKKTMTSNDDSNFKLSFEDPGERTSEGFEPDYSFNWPYDYFSMIELAKLDVKLDFE